MEKNYDAFISYSIEDMEIVDKICDYLEHKGYRCFVAHRDVPRGSVWAAAIMEALNNSVMMVAVFSEFYNASQQTDRELEIASENKMPVLTYCLSASKMTGVKKYYLDKLNRIEAFPNPEDCFGELLDEVSRMVSKAKKDAEIRSKLEAVREARDVADRERRLRERPIPIEDEDTPKSKKKMLPWIIGGAAVVVVVVAVLLLIPKKTNTGGKQSSVAALYPFYKDGKGGYIDKNGNVVVEPKYQNVGYFINGYAGVASNNRWGIIDYTGKEIAPCKYDEFQMYAYGDDRLWFSEENVGVALVYQDEKPVFVDNSGNEITTQEFEKVDPFSEGLASVEKNGKWGFIDKSGRMAIPPTYESVWSFSEGLAAAKEGTYWGFINKKGQWVIKPSYDHARSFSEGLCIVFTGGKYEYIDKSGQVVITAQYGYAWNFSEGLARFARDGKYGYVDKTGREVIPPRYEDASDFHEGLARVVNDGKYGFVDQLGREVVVPQYENALFFVEGLAAVQINGKWGFIDKSGKMVINAQFQSVQVFINGLAQVEAFDGWIYYIDKTGRVVYSYKDVPVDVPTVVILADQSSQLTDAEFNKLIEDVEAFVEALPDYVAVYFSMMGSSQTGITMTNRVWGRSDVEAIVSNNVWCRGGKQYLYGSIISKIQEIGNVPVEDGYYFIDYDTIVPHNTELCMDTSSDKLLFVFAGKVPIDVDVNHMRDKSILNNELYLTIPEKLSGIYCIYYGEDNDPASLGELDYIVQRAPEGQCYSSFSVDSLMSVVNSHCHW